MERRAGWAPGWAPALRLAAVAGSLAAVAALGVMTGVAAGSPERSPAVVAAAAALLAAAGAAGLAVWRLYARPAARSARLLAAAAGHGGGPAPPPEAAAAAAQARLGRLEQANQRLSAVIGGLPQGVLVFGRDGSLQEINPAGWELLGAAGGAAGAAAGDGIGRTGEASSEDGRDGAGGEAGVRATDGAAAGGGRLSAASELLQAHGVAAVAEPALYQGEGAEADVRVPGPEPRWLQAQSQPFAGAGGEPGALVVLRDVTRLRHLEQMRRDFVANVSHELRTPVTSISGFVETLLDNEMCGDAEARRFLQIIQRQSLRLGAIIDDLLSLADIELGEERSSITFADTALAPVISSALLSCGHAAAARGVALQVACDADLTCRMNAQLVEQAVTNLLDNAINYGSRGAPVAVRARRAAGAVLIEVTDAGSGIAPEHRERIFERFYRVDRARSRDYGGTGLGLAIVKHIAQAHDGEVSVRSSVGRGSTFTLRLPG